MLLDNLQGHGLRAVAALDQNTTLSHAGPPRIRMPVARAREYRAISATHGDINHVRYNLIRDSGCYSSDSQVLDERKGEMQPQELFGLQTLFYERGYGICRARMLGPRTRGSNWNPQAEHENERTCK